jgi:flagellar hook-length control protein FliK
LTFAAAALTTTAVPALPNASTLPTGLTDLSASPNTADFAAQLTVLIQGTPASSITSSTPAVTSPTPAEPETQAATDEAEAPADIQVDPALVWSLQVPILTLATVPSTDPSCTSPPGMPPDTGPPLPVTKLTRATAGGQQTEPVPTVDARSTKIGGLTAQETIKGSNQVSQHESNKTEAPVLDGRPLEMRVSGTPVLSDRPGAGLGVAEQFGVDPKEVISVALKLPTAEMPGAHSPFLTRETLTVMPADAVTAEAADAATNVDPSPDVLITPAQLSSHSAATQPSLGASSQSIDLTDIAAEVEAALPTEHARPDNRNAATTRSTKESPGDETAPVPARSRAALGEGHDAGNDESRSSSDADRAPFGPLAQAATQSTDKLTAADSPSTSFHDRLRVVEQVAERLETMRLTQGRQEVTLHLRPEHLGDLRLTITTDGGNVSAQIVAENGMVRQSVDEGREHLRAALEQKGYTLQGLDVSVSQGGHGGSFSPFAPQDERPVYRPFTSQGRVKPEAAVPALSDVSPRRSRNGLDYQA